MGWHEASEQQFSRFFECYRTIDCLISLVSIPTHYLALRSQFCESRKPPFFMKSRFALFLILPVAAFTLAAPPLSVQAKSDTEQICISVGRLLEEGHYTHQPLNDEMSRKFLKTYLELLDFSHLFFTQQEVDALTDKYGI